MQAPAFLAGVSFTTLPLAQLGFRSPHGSECAADVIGVRIIAVLFMNPRSEGVPDVAGGVACG
jgi:hypothetical protein